MKEEEILEYNKRCAEFLRASKTDKRCSINPEYIFPTFTFYKAEMEPDYRGGSYLEHNEHCNIVALCEMKFHSDWNWIMEVRDKIIVLGFNVLIGNNNCVIEQPYGKSSLQLPCIVDRTTKQAVVKAIDKFLTWYEKNNG